jgi:hypothetical protein
VLDPRCICAAGLAVLEGPVAVVCARPREALLAVCGRAVFAAEVELGLAFVDRGEVAEAVVGLGVLAEVAEAVVGRGVWPLVFTFCRLMLVLLAFTLMLTLL